MTTLTIHLPKKEKTRLQRLAVRYGFSLSEFTQHILQEVGSGIPEESFDEYKNSKALKVSFQRALRDWRAGRVSTRL